MKRILWMIFSIGMLCPQAWAQDYGEPVQEPIQNLSSHDWTFESSVNYSSGDYGTGTNTQTIYIPFTIQRNFSQGRVYFTVPYIDQKNGSQVSAFGGQPFRIRGTGIGNTGWNGGVGDLILGGSYDLLREPEKPFDLSAFGSIKFPTADRGKGLGTGEFDEALGLAASKNLDKNWSILGRAGYAFIGDPPGIDLKDQFFYAVGVGYQWDPSTFLSIFYEERTRIINGQPNPRDIVLGIEHKINDTLSIFGNLGFGLTSASADVAVTAGMKLDF